MSYYTGKPEPSGNLAAHMQRRLDRDRPKFVNNLQMYNISNYKPQSWHFLIINNKRQISIKNGRERLYYLSILSVKNITKSLS